MPVYGLPLSLEASLNSLIELRPPTSWRVSGHGNEVTVVLRWTLCGSPSSDKTLDYDIDQCPRSTTGATTSHMWSRGLKRAQNHSPIEEIKTSCSSTYGIPTPSNKQPRFDCFQPVKLRKVETISKQSPRHSSPVPVFLRMADSVLPSDSAEDVQTYLSLSCENIQIADQEQDREVCSRHEKKDCSSSINCPEDSDHHSSSRNPSPIDDVEVRDVNRTYLTPCCSDLSPDRPTVLLDEKSGLFTGLQEQVDDILEVKEDLIQTRGSTLSDQIQNDSGCASESNSTSLSHYVKHTLSLGSNSSSSNSSCSSNSRSQDGSNNKSRNVSRETSRRASSVDQRCSSEGSCVSDTSFALQSRSSKTKIESFDSSNNANLVDEKDDECHSNDLDIICLNEVEKDGNQVRSVSSRTSISYWDSFDSVESELIVDERETDQEQVIHEITKQPNRDVTTTDSL